MVWEDTKWNNHLVPTRLSKIEKRQECQNKNCGYYNSEIENNITLNLQNITTQKVEKMTSQELENFQCNNNKINLLREMIFIDFVDILLIVVLKSLIILSEIRT